MPEAGLSVGRLIAEKERLQGVSAQAQQAVAEVRKIDQALRLLGIEPPPAPSGLGTRGGIERHPCGVGDCTSNFTYKRDVENHRFEKHGIERPGLNEACPTCGEMQKGKTGLSAHRRMRHDWKKGEA